MEHIKSIESAKMVGTQTITGMKEVFQDPKLARAYNKLSFRKRSTIALVDALLSMV